MHAIQKRRVLFCAAVSTIGWGSITYGDVVNWTNTFGGTFNVAGNWNPTLPGATSTAVFGVPGTYNVQLTNSPTNGQLSLVGGNVTLVGSGAPRTYTLGTTGAFISGTASLTLNNVTLTGPTTAGLGTFGVRNGATLSLNTGASVIAQGMAIGDQGTGGQIILSGSGTSITYTGASETFIGNATNAVASLTIQSLAGGSFNGTLGVADSASTGVNATVSLIGAAPITMNSLKIGTGGTVGQAGTFIVNASVVTQGGASTLSIGSSLNSSGALMLSGSGVFNTGTGAISVAANGRIANNGGTFNANGPMTVNAGTYDGSFSGSIFNLAANTPATFHSGAKGNFFGLNLAQPGSSLTATGSNSALTTQLAALVGAAGGSATLNILNSATANLPGLSVGSTGSGVVNVAGGGSLSAFSFNLGAAGQVSGVATLNLSDGSSNVTGGFITIGSNANGGGTVNMTGGTLHGLNPAAVLPSGNLAINGGTAQFDAGLTVSGGVVNKAAAGTLNVTGIQGLDFINNASVTLNGGFQNNPGVSIFGDSGAKLAVPNGSLIIGGGTMLFTGGASAVVNGLRVGFGTLNGFVEIDGPGTTFQSTVFSTIGSPGTATMLFDTGSTGTFDGGFGIANSVFAGNTGAMTINSATVNTNGPIAIGTALGSNGTGVLALTGTNPLLHQTGSGITIGNASACAGTLLLNDTATVDVGSLGLTINKTGTLAFGAATLNLNGAPVLIDGGVLTNFFSGSAVNLGSGAPFTMQNGASATLITSLTFTGGSTLSVTGNSQLSVFGTANISGASVGSMTSGSSISLSVLNVGSSSSGSLNVGAATLSVPGTVFIGNSTGGNGSLSFIAGAVGTFGNVLVGGASGNAKGLVVVNNSSLTINSGLTIGGNFQPGSTGELDLVGTNPVVTLNAFSTLGGNQSLGSLSIAGGTFNNNNLLIVNPGGTISITGGRFNNNGSMQMAGRLNVSSSGDFRMPPNSSLLISGGGIATFSSGFFPQGTVTVNQFGSQLRVPGSAGLQPGSTLNIFTGALVENTNQFVLDGGVINLNGGTLSVNVFAQAFGGAPGTVNFNAGTINYQGSNEFSFPNNAPIFGNDAVLRAGRAIKVNAFASFTTGFVLDGGILDVGSIGFGGDLLTLKTGTLNIQTSNLLVGFGGQLGPVVDLPAGVHVTIPFGHGVSVGFAGRLIVSGGSVFAGSLSIAAGGEVNLTSPAADVGAFGFDNFGLLHGTGQINTFMSNNPGGVIRASAGDRLNFISGLVNAGTISLLGGEIDLSNTSPGLHTNNGYITGRGSLIATGGLTNNGTIALSAGISDVSGAIANNGTIIVTGGGTATFYDSLLQPPLAQFRVSTDSAAVFLGNVTGLASFVGDGKKYFEGSATGGPIITAGSSIVGSSSSLIADAIRENSLTVIGLAKVNANGTSTATSHLKTLTITGTTDDWDGKLDLTNNALVVDYSGASPVATIANQIKSGFHAGDWLGNGITSSLASSTSAHPTALGYGEAGALGLTTTFVGQPTDATSVLVRYTFSGDANLDGKVNALDFNAVANSFGAASAGWIQGDFNYDGTTNTLDFTALGTNFGLVLASPPALGSLVPEPMTPALLVTAIPWLLRRRARRCPAEG